MKRVILLSVLAPAGLWLHRNVLPQCLKGPEHFVGMSLCGAWFDLDGPDGTEDGYVDLRDWAAFERTVSDAQ